MNNACFLEKFSSTTVTPLTREKFDAVAGSVRVNNIINKLKTLQKGTPEFDKTKKLLPMYQASVLCPDDGKRPKKDRHNIEESCWVMHDFDNMEMDVREFFIQKVLPLQDVELHMVMAHITPSGHGLRIIDRRPKGVTIAQHQKWLAQLLGLTLEQDDGISDPNRASYFPSQEYILLDTGELFDATEPYYVEEDLFSDDCFEAEPAQPAADAETSGTTPEPLETSETSAPVASTPYYNTGVNDAAIVADTGFKVMPSHKGVPLNLLVDEIIRNFCTNGLLTQNGHQRDNLCFHAAYALRPIVSGDKQTVIYQLLRDKLAAVGFSDAEIRQKILSALSHSGKYAETASPEVEYLINQLKGKMERVVINAALPKAPKLPKLIEKICTLYPKEFREYVALACLPCFAHCLDNIQTKYNGSPRKLQFGVHVSAPSSSGKSFIAHLMPIIMHKFRDLDKVTEELENADSHRRRSKKQMQNVEVDYKEYRKHFLECTATKAIVYNRIKAANGHSLFLFTEEIKEFDTSMRIGGGFKYILLKSFDYGDVSKATASDDSPNFTGKVSINSLTAGNPVDSHAFLGDNHDGLVNRDIVVMLEQIVGRKGPKFLEPSKKLQQQVDEMVDKLCAVGNGEFTFMEFPALTKAIDDWFENVVYKEFAENQDRTWCVLANRAGDMGYRAGIVFWYLMGCPAGMRNAKNPSKKIREIIDMALWVAEYTRASQYTFLCEVVEKGCNFNQVTIRTGKNKKVFSVLPQQFTTQDYINQKMAVGDKLPSQDAVYKALERLANDGYIEKVGKDLWHKLRELEITA